MSNTLNTEIALVEACQRGDRAAQYKLYHQYAKAMLNTAYRITNDQEEAKDVMQEAFLKIFRNMGSFRGQSTIGAWIKRIVLNTAINQVRKKGLDIVGGMEIVEDHAMPEEAKTGAELDQIRMDAKIAREALQLLPTGYRTVLTLYLLEGYDHKEISQILEIGLSTSLTQYSRGKKRLREVIMKLKEDGSNRQILQGP